MSSGKKPVVVGYDGSEEATKAVAWAARRALHSGSKLLVVHCWIWPLFTHDLGPVDGVEGSGLKNAALAALEEGRKAALAAAPGVDVEARLETGYPAAILTRLSADASMVVTGSRGLGGFLGLLVGSVSLHLASSASCPVAVIRGAEAGGDSVLAAVDGSASSREALLLACQLATEEGIDLQLVHVSQDLPALRFHRHQATPGGEAVLQDAAALARERAPDLNVKETQLAGRSVAGKLVALAADAACLVLGARGADGLAVRLGSTVHAVLHHSKANVIIWRPYEAVPAAGKRTEPGA